jgi:hypothetical protein
MNHSICLTACLSVVCLSVLSVLFCVFFCRVWTFLDSRLFSLFFWQILATPFQQIEHLCQPKDGHTFSSESVEQMDLVLRQVREDVDEVPRL